jgi:hypothetical protein
MDCHLNNLSLHETAANPEGHQDEDKVTSIHHKRERYNPSISRKMPIPCTLALDTMLFLAAPAKLKPPWDKL